MRKVLRLLFKTILFSAAFVLLAGTGAYFFALTTTVGVTNETGKDLANAQIRLNRHVIWQGHLSTDEREWTFGTGGGHIVISYKLDDRHIIQHCAYAGAMSHEWYSIKPEGWIPGCVDNEALCREKHYNCEPQDSR